MALSVEAAELLEHFQWLSEDNSANLDPAALEAVSSEIADVQIYLLRLADKLCIDIEKSVEAKLKENDQKYPAEVVKGSAAKYTEYE